MQDKNSMRTMAKMAGLLSNDLESAIESLKSAIARHKRHMDGKEPTNKSSQMKMMDEMQEALEVLMSMRKT